MYFDIKTSRARKIFKRLLGQTNHYLVTILLGLDYIQNNEIELPQEFSTSWNPKDKKSSTIRSREFTINATLSWAIDALDAYLSLCHKRPTLYQEKTIQDEASGAERYVNAKYFVLRNYVGDGYLDDFKRVAALTEVAIQWRNNLVHFSAENIIDDSTRLYLISESEYFRENFQGLKITEFLNRFDGNQTPRFKEITSIIRAIHKFVEISDDYMLNNIDKSLHLVDCIDYHLKVSSKNDKELKQKISLIYNLNTERRINKLNQIIMNYGFTLTEQNDTGINQDWIERLANLSLDEVMNFLKEPELTAKKSFIDKPNKKNKKS